MDDWHAWDETQVTPTFRFGDRLEVVLSDGRVEAGRPEEFHWFRHGSQRSVVRRWRLVGYEPTPRQIYDATR